jgi:hypothetical protein
MGIRISGRLMATYSATKELVNTTWPVHAVYLNNRISMSLPKVRIVRMVVSFLSYTSLVSFLSYVEVTYLSTVVRLSRMAALSGVAAVPVSVTVS